MILSYEERRSVLARRTGLHKGCKIKVLKKRQNSILIECNGRILELDNSIAEKIMVEED